MIEGKGDDRRIKPGVEGIEHSARHRNPIVGLKHGRCIGQHGGYGVAPRDSGLLQGGGELAGPCVELRISETLTAVDDGGVAGVDTGRTFQKRQRAQRLIVCGIFRKIGFVAAHHAQP